MSQEAPVETVFSCSQCGRALAHSDLVQIAGNWVCADCKPAFLSRVMASGVAEAPAPPVAASTHSSMSTIERVIDGLLRDWIQLHLLG